jgi:hypothetical protein
MGWGHIKIFFSRTTGPILTRLGTNHPWRERIQVSLKEGDSPSPREDDSRPKSIKLSTNYPLVKRIQICSNKGPGAVFKRG